MTDLKPCPFGCAANEPGGSDVSLRSTAWDVCFVECNNCCCEGPTGSSPAEAVQLWNWRADDAIKLAQEVIAGMARPGDNQPPSA